MGHIFRFIAEKAGKFLVARALPFILSNLSWKLKQIEAADGFYIWIFVKVFSWVLVDEQIKISGQTTRDIKTNEVLRLETPIDVEFTRAGSIEQKLSEWSAQANKRLLNATQNGGDR